MKFFQKDIVGHVAVLIGFCTFYQIYNLELFRHADVMLLIFSGVGILLVVLGIYRIKNPKARRINEKGGPLGKRFLGGLLTLVLFLLLWGISAVGFIQIYDWQAKKEIKLSVPQNFPVVIFTLEDNGIVKTNVIEYSSIGQFIESHPNYSFLFPVREIQNRNLFIIGTYKVTFLEEGKQYIELSDKRDSDRVNVGWYEATEKETAPKYHKFYFGPGSVLVSSGIGFFVALPFLIFIKFLYKKIKKNKYPVLDSTSPI